jgi:hypothetical protein
MKLWLVLVGLFWLGSLAMMAFMLAAFAGGGIANGGKVGAWGLKFLDISLLALPALCIVAMVMLWVAYSKDWGTVHYWWNAFPIPFLAFYFLVLSFVGK